MNQAFYERLYINDDETVTSELAEPFAILLGDQLTTGVEAALAAEAKNPPPETGTTGPATTSDTHTQHVEGLNERLWVELLKLYSNQNINLGKLQQLLDLPQRRGVTARRPRKQTQRRLTPDQVADLLAAYEAGETVLDLATSFGVHRTTVTNLLKRHGVPFRPPGLDPADLPEAIRLYKAGWSLALLGQHFGMTGHNTISDALRRAGVTIRPRRGRQTSPGDR